MQEIVNFIYDDYRQVLLAAHKRMDIIVGSLLMTGEATVKNKDDNAGGVDLLNIELPFKFIKPDTGAKTNFITYLQQQINALKADYGNFQKMIMSRGTFVKNIIGSAEFGDKFKMQLTGNEMYLSTGLITSQLASQVFTGIGLPAIEIKEDYVKDQTGKNVQIYADDRITCFRRIRSVICVSTLHTKQWTAYRDVTTPRQTVICLFPVTRTRTVVIWNTPQSGFLRLRTRI